MDKLAIFLTVAFIALRAIKPITERTLLRYSIGIPISTLLLVMLAYIVLASAFRAGQALSLSFIPAIVSGFVIHYGLKEKHKTGERYFPTLTLIAAIIAWGIAAYLDVQERKLDEFFKNYNPNTQSDSTSTDRLSTSKPDILMKEVVFKDVAITIPTDWEYNSSIISNDSVHQMICRPINTPNIVILQWRQSNGSLKEMLDHHYNSFHSRTEYKAKDFANYTDTMLYGCKALKGSFTMYAVDRRVLNTIIVFKYNSRIFSVIFSGDNGFYTSGVVQSISNSLKIGSDRNPSTATSPTKTPTDWTIYEIKQIGQISIPPSLKLRKDNSFSYYAVKTIHNLFKMQGINMTASNLVFQPKGMDNLQTDAFEKYSRVLIKVTTGKPGDYYKINERFEFTDAEHNELNSYYFNETETQLRKAGASILKWFPIAFTTINGMCTLKCSFIRVIQHNEPVLVHSYLFFNYDECIEVTLSYRQTEAKIWQTDFENIIKAFEITNRK